MPIGDVKANCGNRYETAFDQRRDWKAQSSKGKRFEDAQITLPFIFSWCVHALVTLSSVICPDADWPRLPQHHPRGLPTEPGQGLLQHGAIAPPPPVNIKTLHAPTPSEGLSTCPQRGPRLEASGDLLWPRGPREPPEDLVRFVPSTAFQERALSLSLSLSLPVRHVILYHSSPAVRCWPGDYVKQNPKCGLFTYTWSSTTHHWQKQLTLFNLMSSPSPFKPAAADPDPGHDIRYKAMTSSTRPWHHQLCGRVHSGAVILSWLGTVRSPSSFRQGS